MFYSCLGSLQLLLLLEMLLFYKVHLRRAAFLCRMSAFQVLVWYQANLLKPLKYFCNEFVDSFRVLYKRSVEITAFSFLIKCFSSHFCFLSVLVRGGKTKPLLTDGFPYHYKNCCMCFLMTSCLVYNSYIIQLTHLKCKSS